MRRALVTRTKRWLAAAALLATMAAGTAAMVAFAATSGHAEGKPPVAAATPVTATPTPSASTPTPAASTPSPTSVVPTPAAKPVETPPPPPVPQHSTELLPPLGPVSADPVRVHTGDSDCLNVRPAPGTTFQTDALFCLSEGATLWLSGPAQVVDGQTWRFALGLGWVAARYTVPDPKPAKPFPALLKGLGVVQRDGDFANVGRLDSKLNVLSRGSVLTRSQGIGTAPPRLSPSGEYVAYPDVDQGRPITRIARLADGFVFSYPNTWYEGWSSDNRLLLGTQVCSPECRSGLSVADPRTGQQAEFAPPAAGYYGSGAWAPDGKSILFVPDGKSVVRIALDGTRTTVATIPDGAGLGEISVSPDGNFLLGAGTLAPLRVVDLRDGSMRELPRAQARTQIGGSCGSGASQRSGWIDSTRVVYHESFAENRANNGITLVNLADNTRRVFSFAFVQDLQLAAPGLLSFTSGDATWLLDLATGESWPVAVGAGAVWLH
jgi:hypothetical protein